MSSYRFGKHPPEHDYRTRSQLTQEATGEAAGMGTSAQEGAARTLSTS